jgi:cytochrome c-type biogenesis protein CcmH
MNTLAVGLTLLVLLALLMLLIPLLKRNASRQLVIAVMMFLPLFSLSLYAWIGNPLITSRHEAKDLSSQEMQGLITKLSKRLATEPNDLEGWRLLAHSHLAQHNLSQAQQAFEQVHRLDPSDIGTTLSLIDVLVTQNQGQITQQAKSLIDTALQQEPSNSSLLFC